MDAFMFLRGYGSTEAGDHKKGGKKKTLERPRECPGAHIVT